MNFFKQWLVPLIAALLLVLVFRFFLFDFMLVPDNLMNNGLKKGDLILIQKRTRIKRNNIILIDTLQANYTGTGRLIRCVALPGDTLLIRNSEIFINRKKVKQEALRKGEVLSQYIASTNNTDFQQVLLENNIIFNPKLASFGIYHFSTDKKSIQKISKQNAANIFKKTNSSKGLYSKETAPFNKHFYWNKDNFGALVVPAFGMSIKLNRANFELYKKIIETETGKNYIVKGNTIYASNKIVRNYTFQSDYYFTLNDNRPNTNDSRSFGFIRKDQIFGKFVLKLF